MEWNIHEAHTLYAVHLYLPDDTEARIGALGTFLFRKGNYVYIGSAKKNIKSTQKDLYRPKKH